MANDNTVLRSLQELELHLFIHYVPILDIEYGKRQHSSNILSRYSMNNMASEIYAKFH